MNTRILGLATLAAALAACGSAPVQSDALEQARSRFNAAQGDAQVSTLAPDELKRAGEALRVADKAAADGAKPATLEHLAYLTGQRVVIAQETAANKASLAITAGAAAERDKLRLAMRTNEADTAQQQLAMAQQSNAQKTAALAAAEAAAMAEKARVERRDAKVSDLESQLKDLNAKQTDRGMVVTLGDVLFDSGKARLLADTSGNMVKLADFFKRNPKRQASIEGYTDSVGAAEANVELSDRRAQAVRTALVNLGVPSEHLRTQAHGEEQPAASNATSAGRQMNRRVEIVITPQSGDTPSK